MLKARDNYLVLLVGVLLLDNATVVAQNLTLSQYNALNTLLTDLGCFANASTCSLKNFTTSTACTTNCYATNNCVLCDTNGNVVQIRLSFVSLLGSLGTAIGALSSLGYIDVSNNLLRSTLISQIGLLSGLTYVDINNNLLEGSIPAELGNLTSLNYLDLSRNVRLSGTVPAFFSRLTYLETLLLYACDLSGSIPFIQAPLTDCKFEGGGYVGNCVDIPSSPNCASNMTSGTCLCDPLAASSPFCAQTLTLPISSTANAVLSTQPPTTIDMSVLPTAISSRLSSSLAAGAIIGINAAITCGIVLAVVAVFILWWTKRARVDVVAMVTPRAPYEDLPPLQPHSEGHSSITHLNRDVVSVHEDV
jgi:hypothetical protein